jgi:hypothetical protein
MSDYFLRSVFHLTLSPIFFILLELVLNRADLLDIEEGLCQVDGRSTEIWKTRFEPLLLLTGPCALGIAVNQVLGNDSVSNINPGWLEARTPELNAEIGDALVLLVSGIYTCFFSEAVGKTNNSMSSFFIQMYTAR